MTIRKILELTFERAGWPVCTFADGVRTLTALKRAEIPVPEALVLEVSLPKRNGYAVARAFKHQEGCQHCVIVFLASQSGLFASLRRRLAGSDAYLTTPFTATEVLWTLRVALRRVRETSARAAGGSGKRR